MENSIYLGLSRQTVLRTNMDMIANNIANMNTPGYRSQHMLFEEYISKPKGYDDPLSFVWNKGQYQNTKEGPLTQTGNPLDIALAGPGFFGVQGPDGETVYSRAGNLQIGSDGTLRNSADFAIAGQGGGAIVIPANSTEVKIDKNGFVSNQDGQLGQIMVVEFENLQALDPMGNTLYKSSIDGQPAQNTVVQQGMVEGSNVNGVVEMTAMIKTLRSHQSTQNILRTENERLRGAIRSLTGRN